VRGLKAKTVLIFSGLDPSGGAGVSADIETISHFGISPLPIVTTLTAQNTQEVKLVETTNTDLIEMQFKLLAQDIPFNTVKIGLLGSFEQIKTITKLLQVKPNLNIVIDPVICSGNEEQLLNQNSIYFLKDKLLPMAKILTPNLNELNYLAPGLDEQSAISSLDCPWVLVTTTDTSDVNIEHRLYNNSKLVKYFRFKKLPGKYHGSGCTLSSAIAALLASDVSVEDACSRALDYTYQTLLGAKELGKMQYHPNRNLSK